MLAGEADEAVYNIVQLIYRSRSYEGIVQGLRVLAPHDGGALARWLQRREPRAAPSRDCCAGPTISRVSACSISPSMAAQAKRRDSLRQTAAAKRVDDERSRRPKNAPSPCR